uniref:Uncharacterized protein n=1 Tax=Arundo donax TaxID=35708 RepID=A0A0A9BF11_ARUDO
MIRISIATKKDNRTIISKTRLVRNCNGGKRFIHATLIRVSTF